MVSKKNHRWSISKWQWLYNYLCKKRGKILITVEKNKLLETIYERVNFLVLSLIFEIGFFFSHSKSVK
jgi:hypothetical protein